MILRKRDIQALKKFTIKIVRLGAFVGGYKTLAAKSWLMRHTRVLDYSCKA